MNEFQERIGVGKRQYAYGRIGETQTSSVIGYSGKVVGSTTEHRSGRVDATATVQPVRLQGNLTNGKPDFTTVRLKETP